MQVNIQLLDKACMPERAHDTDACYDLKARCFVINGKEVDETYIIPGQTILVPAGFKICLARYWEAQIRPRSGLALKNNITVLNTPGTIDCVPKGTKISTPLGNINVEDILSNNDKVSVYSFNEETCDKEVDSVSDCWIVKNKEMIEIEADGNVIQVPVEKEVFTKRGWVRAKNLNENDEVLIIE